MRVVPTFIVAPFIKFRKEVFALSLATSTKGFQLCFLSLQKIFLERVFMKKLLVLFLLLFSYSLAQNITSLKRQAVLNYATIVSASYQDSLLLAKSLERSIMAFVANSSESTLQDAKGSWLATRDVYGQTEAYRFYGGPIDDEDGPEGLLNAWPLDEAYIDYVEGNPNAGIINNVAEYPQITKELLLSLNEQGGEENVSVGFHAIEFLLWGQDLDREGAGARPYTDFTTATNAERRKAYLLITSSLLIENLEELVAEWDTRGNNYRTQFLALPPDEALTHILTGIGVLAKSELGGERIFTAYDNQDQEDEHSCFSDNTHSDIIANFKGVQNVYLGTYTRPYGSVISGVSIADVLEATNPALNAEVKALLHKSGQQVQNVYVPFDRAITDAPHRQGVLDLTQSLFSLGDNIAQTASALNLTIDTSLPE